MVARNRDEELSRRNMKEATQKAAEERQRELQREFLLEQMEELSLDFSDNPEQIGLYLADLESAGLLAPADKGMIFRRLWEAMGPAFADQAFGMSQRALESDSVLAAEIAEEAFVDVEGNTALFGDRDSYENALEATRALEGLAAALGLKIQMPRPEFKRKVDDKILDADPDRAAKTREVLDTLGGELGVNTRDLDVHVDEVATQKTAEQGIWGLMTDGSVFLDPEIYDPETEEGRHLLAHEVVHVAQLENRLRGANDAPDLFQAEAEADQLSASFAETGKIGAAPLASLARYDQAACGPREMAEPTPTPEPEPDPKQPRTEVVREPEIFEIVKDEVKVDPIFFNVDKYTIPETKPNAVPTLEKAARTLKAYPEITKLHIEGHTSTTATFAYNMTLSERRAGSVKDYLTGKVQTTLTSKGYGEIEARKALGIKDDRRQVEVSGHRKVIFRIVEVDGKAVPAGWKPTRKVILMPGRTITRYYDKDGKLIKEEVVVDTAGGKEGKGGANGTTPTNPNQTAPAGQQQTEGGQPTQPAPQTEVKPQLPGGGGPTGPDTEPERPQQPAPGRTQVTFKKKIKNPNRNKKARVARRFAAPSPKSVLQAKAGAGGLSTTEIDQTTRSSGGGEQIPDQVRGRFEQAFGQSFSDVRIHRGSAQATGIGASAFARGTDIHFAPGRFDPDSSSGLAVLGHELTHIVQQRAGRVAIPQGKGTHVNVERNLESEADLLGARAARGETVRVEGSAAGLYARAASGAADTIQYEGGQGATQAAPSESGGGGARPEFAEVRLAGQRIRARMPAGAQQPGQITVDFSSAASIPGLTLGQAQLTFNSSWEIERGHITARVAVGEYVRCDDVRLEVTQRQDSTGKYAELAASINDAQFKINGLLDSRINLRLSNRGISGSANVQFAQMTLGQGITLAGGSLTFTLTEGGQATVSGVVNGQISVGGANLNVEIRGQAMTGGALSGAVKITLANAVNLPGVEGVQIKAGEVNGRYTHNQAWSVRGSLTVNVRNWVEGTISASYTSTAGAGAGAGGAGGGGGGAAVAGPGGGGPAREGGGGGGAGGGAAGGSSWELSGVLRQVQAYTVGTGENALTLSAGQLGVQFKDGRFIKTDAKATFDTTNWKGDIDGTFDVQQQKVSATGRINMKPPQLPIGTTGIKFTKVAAVVIVKDNALEKITGNVTVVFPYQEQDTFELKGTDVFYVVKDNKVTGTATVTTLRPLDFGDPAGYNATVKQGAVGTLSVADNKLLGISGGLAFDVKHAASKIGNGTVDVNFDGPTQKLNATAKFSLTAPEGFGIPDRVAGPVLLKPGGQFQLTIENSKLGAATVRGVKFEVKQTGGTGKIEGDFNGNYNFQTSKLTATGNAQLKANWPLAPAEGVTLTFKNGGRIEVAATDSKLTRVNGNFPYEASVAARGSIPEIKLEGGLNGNYSDETKKFGGELTGTLKNNVDIPVNDDKITIKANSNFKATVRDSAPGDFNVAFAVDYTRKGELFLQGNVEKATYDFKKGHFGFKGDLTLKAKIEKQTEDGKWKFVVNPGTRVGVEVAESKLQLITGMIAFEVHDATGALLKGQLMDAKVDVQKLEFSGKLQVALARDLKYPRTPEGAEEAPKGSPPVQAVAKKDVSLVWGTVSKNQLTEIGAKLHFGVNLAGVEYGAGQLNGTLDMKQFQFSGDGKINLVKDLIIGGNERNASGEKIQSWHLAFPAGQGLDMKVSKNQLDEANINLNGKLLNNLEEVANGSVTGRYKLGETKGFNGLINANVIKDVDWSQDQRFKYWVETGTNFKAVITSNAIESLNGNFKLRLDEIPNGNKQAVRVSLNGNYVKGTGFNAEGNINVLNDLKVGQGTDYKFFIARDSTGGASVVGQKVTRLHGNLTLNVKKGETAFAKGTFNLDYNHNDAGAKLNCQGQVDLLARTDVSPQGATDWRFFLMPATGVGFKVTENQLDYIRGQVNANVGFKGADVISGNVNADFVNRPAPLFSANGNIRVTSDIRVGDNLPGGYKIVIEPSPAANFDVKNNELKSIGGTVKVRIEDKSPLARVELNGTYKHAPERRFDGTGSITLIRKLEIGRSDDGKYKFNVLEGTGAQATVANNKLESITGSLNANIEDDREFARFNGSVTARKVNDAWKLSTEGATLGVTRDKEFDLKGEWKVTLCAPSGGTLVLSNNKVDKISGNIIVKVEKGAKFAGKVTLNGEYTPSAGFSGQGKGELLQDFEVGQRPPYGFVILKGGTEAVLDVAASKVSHVGGRVNFKVTENAKDFVKGTVSVDYDVAKGTLTEAKGEGILANDKVLGTYSGFTLVAVKGSNASFHAQNGDLVRVGGNLNLRVDEGGRELAKGNVNADFDVKGAKFTGSGEVTLTRDYAVSARGLNGHGQPESWGLAIKSQSKLAFSIKNNEFETAHIDVKAVGYHNGAPKADGAINADYKIGDPNGVTGHVELNVRQRIPLLEGSGRFDYHIDQGTNFSGDVTKGSIKQVQGTFKLAVTETSKDKVIVTANASYTAGKGVDGGGTVKVVDPILIKEGGEWKIFLDAGSGGNASVKASKLEEIGGQIKLRVDKGRDPFATGDFTATYKVADGRNSQVTATGRVTLIGRVNVTPGGGGEFKVWLTGGSNIGASVKNGDLEYVDGQIKGDLDWKGATLARFDLQGKYSSQPADFSGTGKLETIKAVKVTDFGGYSLYLGNGANITGSVKAFALDELTANIPLELHKPAGTKVVQASLTGKYKHAERKFDGNGNATVVKQITIAEGVGAKGYSFYLMPSTGVNAEVKANALKKVDGTLVVLVSDAPGAAAGFLRATARATYEGGEAPNVTANGKLEVIRDKTMLTSAGGFVVVLKKGAEATVDVVKNDLKQIGGKINIEVQKGGAFAKIGLSGQYTPDAGFSGKGTAELCQEWQIAGTRIGDDNYTVWVTKGTGAEITLQSSDIKHIGGTVKAMIRDTPNASGNFIQVEAKADYDFPGKNFSGSGSITVLKPKKLATFAGEELWLAQGGGATGSVANNNLESVNGNLTLQLKDTKVGHWLTCKLAGGFDAKGGTGFSGKGSVEVHKDKQLAQLGSYKFVLAQGAGAS
ncbi:MAG: DUF4157 domain-containing protein, partial [Deltaproteobacteria bacterium]|nr:DUF4157 domain-containing protein [Deltaproteobacteria bacterium]